jgi:hypothetical protein
MDRESRQDRAEVVLGRLLEADSPLEARERVGRAVQDLQRSVSPAVAHVRLAERVHAHVSSRAAAVLDTARSLDENVLGIVATLLRQLDSGRWKSLVTQLAAVADPLSTLLVWRAQRRRRLTPEDEAYLDTRGDGQEIPTWVRWRYPTARADWNPTVFAIAPTGTLAPPMLTISWCARSLL